MTSRMSHKNKMMKRWSSFLWMILVVIIILITTNVCFFVDGASSRPATTNTNEYHRRQKTSSISSIVGGNNNIPRSEGYDYNIDEDEDEKEYIRKWLWNPGGKRMMDDNGFFLDTSYVCTVGNFEDEIQLRGRYGLRSKHSQRLSTWKVQVRQVPGDGNCLFHSIAATLSVVEPPYQHLKFGSKHAKQKCYQLRQRSIQYLQEQIKKNNQNKHRKRQKLLFLQGCDSLQACDLVQHASSQYNLSQNEYCTIMKQNGVWGGGPEIVALSNALRRPIHVYQLSTTTTTTTTNDDEGNEDNVSFFYRKKKKKNSKKVFIFRRLACFGSPKFDSKEPLHILSADSRFPNISPGKQLKSGNHFLALFITPPYQQQQRTKQRRMLQQKERKNKRMMRMMKHHHNHHNNRRIQQTSIKGKKQGKINFKTSQKKQLSLIRTNDNPQLMEIVQKLVQSSQNTITNAYQRAFVPKQ